MPYVIEKGAATDRRRTAVEPCDRCGARTLCTRAACPDCELLFSTCERCQADTGRQAIVWEVEGHRRRAHLQPPAASRQPPARDEIGHRRHRRVGERRIVRKDAQP